MVNRQREDVEKKSKWLLTFLLGDCISPSVLLHMFEDESFLAFGSVHINQGTACDWTDLKIDIFFI
jgi:hypothetical protein